jgi:hypothetical protein
MMAPKLFMVLLGCKPPGRHTEQHDVFFGIAEQLRDLIPDFKLFWPEAKGKLHVDGWREVQYVNGYRVELVPREQALPQTIKLFFINLGGYKPGEFEEFHYKMLVAAPSKAEAVRYAKQTAFFKHTGFKGANAHIDDQYGVDVDDVVEVEEILPAAVREQYALQYEELNGLSADHMYLGYYKLSML